MATRSGRWRTKGDQRMSLGDHLRELRKRLFISAIAIVIAAVIAFVNWGFLGDLLHLPFPLSSLTDFVRDGMRVPIDKLAENHNATISYTTVSGAFDLTVQIGLTVAILIASPVWLYQVFAFLVPGLTSREKKYTFGFFFSAVPLFLAGGFTGWLLFPHMVELLASFAPTEDSLLVDAKYYYDFIIKLVLAVGVGFVLPVFLVLLNFVGVLTAQAILKGWRVAILVITLFCAIATPAVDVASMFLLAIPMVALYFAAVLVATIHDRGVARRLAKVEAESVPVGGAVTDQLSPAERFAAAKKRKGHPLLEAFRAAQKFDLDTYQLAACEVVEDGKSVLVAAPTGAGKTVVAEFAIFRAMQAQADKVFYTAPMKALSNQKFQELQAEYGESQVGLLTGDTNINSHARIVVMTTEVLRNMLYANSDLLRDLAVVVMDEVHFLGDRFRGAVWEEVIIHLPQHVRMVSLSATVSNAEEFGDWLQAVRGDTEVIVSEERPVPLDQHILMRGKLVDLFDSSGLAATHRVNPELVQMARYGGRTLSARQMQDVGRRHSKGGRPDVARVERPEVVKLLDGKNLLPAIFFIFSRVGCDQAVTKVLRSGIRLTTPAERDEIRAIVEDRCRTLLDEDLAVLGYWDWLTGLERGVAAHHAGLLPAFKEVVEELFQKKLVKVVFATETLALGINMPARTVVLEKLEKFNGEARVPITPGEYTQLTGRAGRRGIDVEGHSVIQWIDGLDPQAVASLASRRTYPLNSSFKPTYNMAVNLIEQFGRERTREILESSFAQFQADRAVVDLARKVRSQQTSLEGYANSMKCHLGDFGEYSTIRRELTDLERKGISNTASRVERDKRQRQLVDLRRRMKQHPCHACPERESHARWAERYWRLKRETDQLTAQIRTRTGAVAKVFDRVTDVLVELKYLVPTGAELALSADGRMLRRIYGERDLLVAESLRRGFWDDLDPASLAAMATTLIYEPRREEGQLGDRYLPRGRFREAFDVTGNLWSELDDLERLHKLPGTQPLSTGLALAMYRWASGTGLDAVLQEADMAAGDFVRWTKQTIDLLDQLSVVAPSEVGRTARTALDAIRRGIVAYSSVA